MDAIFNEIRRRLRKRTNVPEPKRRVSDDAGHFSFAYNRARGCRPVRQRKKSSLKVPREELSASYFKGESPQQLVSLLADLGRKSGAQSRATELLANVGLEPKLHARPEELSQGEQQRVAVCRAMFSNPALLLADEPTGNLDQENKQNVVDLLQDQAKRNNSTLLMVTHDESLLDRFDTVLDMGSVAQPFDVK